MAKINIHGVNIIKDRFSIEQNDGSVSLLICKRAVFKKSSNFKANIINNAVRVAMAESIEAKTCFGTIVL